MVASLSAGQIAHYRENGFVSPVRVFSKGEASRIRRQIEGLERSHSKGAGGYSLNQLFRVNGQVTIPLLAQIAQTPAILDAVEAVIGPDLLVWSCELFIKEAGSSKVVSWHQDLTYWGMGETDEELTAWIAVSDVTELAGCMRFIPGSHKQPIQPHHDTFDADNLLSRGQEFAGAVDESKAFPNTLLPGEMSLHHGRLLHASGPNQSMDRRIGMAIRYVTPHIDKQSTTTDYAMLVRGADHAQNWTHVPPPQSIFAPSSLALYNRILDHQSSVLAAGAGEFVELYAKAAGDVGTEGDFGGGNQ